jgi:disulfide bond formation protein DsbB
MLATAHIFQRFGYEPCALCLRQREVYWTALPLALGGFLLLRARPELARVVPALLAAVFLTGFGVAGYHAGIEWGWWPAPSSCGGGGAFDPASLDALMSGAPVRVVLCDEAAWTMLGVSMAGWNALASLGLAGLGLWVAASGRSARARGLARA